MVGSPSRGRLDAVGRAAARRVRLDARTLAAFRIALGLVVLADLLLRARNLVAFYTDAGVLPVGALAESFPVYRYLSLHALSGSATVQVALFAAAGVAAVALVVGYRTRAATVVSLLLLVSLQARNPMVLNGGDPLLRRLLFWSVFLPLGARWSVDARHRESTRGAVSSVASAGLLLQVVFVYLANLGFKLQGDAWLGGGAVRQALALDGYTVFLGDALATVPALLTAVDWGWLALLAASPLLVLATGRLRTALAAALVAVHLGMLATLQLGLFPVVSTVALLPFFDDALAGVALPARVDRGLDRLAAVLPRGPRFPAPARVRAGLGRVTAVALALVLVGLVLLNAIALGVVAAPPGTPDAVADRSWDMFAPAPPGEDVGFVAPATLASGRTVDAFNRRPLPTDGPPDGAWAYPTARWHKYVTEVAAASDRQREDLARYLCRRWNDGRDDGMVDVRLIALRQDASLEGPEPTRRVVLGEYRCRGESPGP